MQKYDFYLFGDEITAVEVSNQQHYAQFPEANSKLQIEKWSKCQQKSLIIWSWIRIRNVIVGMKVSMPQHPFFGCAL